MPLKITMQPLSACCPDRMKPRCTSLVWGYRSLASLANSVRLYTVTDLGAPLRPTHDLWLLAPVMREDSAFGLLGAASRGSYSPVDLRP